MAWNNGFPATYGQMYPQGYPLQQPMAGTQMSLPAQQMSPTQMPVTNQPAPMMTPPTIRAEIIQVDDDGWENYVDRFPLGPGASQMFITRGESNIIIKSMGQTGPLPLVVFDKRPPSPPAPTFDPGEYVRKDELESSVKALLAAHSATSTHATPPVTQQTATRRAVRRDREEDE